MISPPDDEPLARFRSLQQRDSGEEPDRTLYDDIPDHLQRPLEDWLRSALQDKQEVARTVLLRCRLSVDRWNPTGNYADALRQAILYGPMADYGPLDLLNAFINLHDDWATPRRANTTKEKAWLKHVIDLERLLVDAGSAWTIDPEFRELHRRVDPTVAEAREAAEKAARDAGRPTAAEHLRAAWHETYGVRPDPTEAYEQAVKAIEAAAARIVAPKNPAPTLGQLLADMRAQGWWLTIVDKQDQPWPAATFVDLLDQLWKGQRSRHGGGATSRSQTQAEAEAAVHLAALAVQWLTTGVLQRKASAP